MDENNQEEKKGISWIIIAMIMVIGFGVGFLLFVLTHNNPQNIPNSTTANIDEQGNILEGDNIGVTPSDENADEITKQVIGQQSSQVTINILPATSGEETK